MIRVLGCWCSALAIWLFGIGLSAQALPQVEPGDSLSDFDQIVNVHLPWIVIVFLMALAAGALYRDRSRPGRRLLAILLVPALVTLFGAVAGFAGQTSAVNAVLYFAEGAGGTLGGLLVANMISLKQEATPGYW